MVDLQKRQRERLEVMNAIYEAADGRQDEMVSIEPIRQSLDMADEEIADACKYLEGEYLITNGVYVMAARAPMYVTLSHLGVKEMEAAQSKPDEATRYFPPYSVIQHFYGDVVGSIIQSASPGASANIGITIADLGGVREFLATWDRLAQALNLAPEAAEEAAAEIATLRAQLQSPKPKKGIVHDALIGLRSLLMTTGSTIAATEAITLADHLIHSLAS